MPIPDEGLPQVDELIEDESNEVEAAAQEPIAEAEAEEDELEFETVDVDNSDDIVEFDEESDRDTASFGYGDPAD